MFDILQKAAIAGGKVLLHYFETELDLTEKTSQHDVVTIADITAQKAIQEILIAEMMKAGYKKEEIGFIGEENLQDEKKYTFIIDPLDGTSNFTSGLDWFAVSIGLFENRKPLAGIIYRPTANTFYFAESGKGAYTINSNKRVLLEMKKPHFKEGLMVSNISTDDAIRNRLLPIVNRGIKHFKNMRVLGAAALDLCYLADNRCCLVLYGKTSIWDIAAGLIIVRESGGNVYDWQGKELQISFEERKKIYPILAVHPQKLKESLTFIES